MSQRELAVEPREQVQADDGDSVDHRLRELEHHEILGEGRDEQRQRQKGDEDDVTGLQAGFRAGRSGPRNGAVFAFGRFADVVMNDRFLLYGHVRLARRRRDRRGRRV